jgi:hypothetical protein
MLSSKETQKLLGAETPIPVRMKVNLLNVRALIEWFRTRKERIEKQAK